MLSIEETVHASSLFAGCAIRHTESILHEIRVLA
jgi:hypothetical protein